VEIPDTSARPGTVAVVTVIAKKNYKKLLLAAGDKKVE
jgi:hypothetical protein